MSLSRCKSLNQTASVCMPYIVNVLSEVTLAALFIELVTVPLIHSKYMWTVRIVCIILFLVIRKEIMSEELTTSKHSYGYLVQYQFRD